MFIIDFWAETLSDDGGWVTYNIASGVMGAFTLGWVFHNGFITFGFNTNTTSFTTVDPNVMAVILAVVTIMSFFRIFTRVRSSR